MLPLVGIYINELYAIRVSLVNLTFCPLRLSIEQETIPQSLAARTFGRCAKHPRFDPFNGDSFKDNFLLTKYFLFYL